jgi:hypothetical protein
VAGVYLSTVPYLLPPRYTLYKYISLHLFTQGKGGGGVEEGVNEPVKKVRGALFHKRGRKYQYIALQTKILDILAF